MGQLDWYLWPHLLSQSTPYKAQYAVKRRAGYIALVIVPFSGSTFLADPAFSVVVVEFVC